MKNIPSRPKQIASITNFALSYLICSLATVFLLYAFILQVAPSVMMESLMYDLKLSPTDLGAMTAFYYYAYTPMQLPAGLLLDRFGPRRLLTFATLTCAIGALCFSLAGHMAMAAIGRFLMGIGSAFSFIGALVLVARWFSPHYFAVLAGIVQLSASLGAIAGQAPLALALQQWGWRNTLWNLALFGLMLAGLIGLIVRDAPATGNNKSKSVSSFKEEMQRLKHVLRNAQTWAVGLYAFAVWTPVAAFAALWGIPFLTTAYSLDITTASSACAMIWLGIGLGSPLLGWWSDKIAQRRLPLTLSAILGSISLIWAIYGALPLVWLYCALFAVGLGAAGQVLAFSVVKDNNPPNITGTAIGFNNMAVVAGGALFQPMIGWLLHTGINNTQDISAYQQALFILPLCYFIAAIVSHFGLKETHCKPTYL